MTIKELRAEKKLSQVKFAESVGVSSSLIGAIEQGSKKVSANRNACPQNQQLSVPWSWQAVQGRPSTEFHCLLLEAYYRVCRIFQEDIRICRE